MTQSRKIHHPRVTRVWCWTAGEKGSLPGAAGAPAASVLLRPQWTSRALVADARGATDACQVATGLILGLFLTQTRRFAGGGDGVQRFAGKPCTPVSSCSHGSATKRAPRVYRRRLSPSRVQTQVLGFTAEDRACCGRLEALHRYVITFIVLIPCTV